MAEGKSLACIVIPVYKTIISDGEKKSLSSCLRIFKDYSVILAFPEGLSVKEYLTIEPTLKLEAFKTDFFQDINGYNRLLMSEVFYGRFKKYKFILIYQLDAFVFRNELGFWCAQNYDFIGAPWFEGWHNARHESRIIGVGNGGFCLRNISRFRSILRSLAYYRFWFKVRYKLGLEKYLSDGFYFRLISFRWFEKFDPIALRDLMRGYGHNEDYFWCVLVPQFFRFKLPSIEEAMKFSFEANPSLLFSMNGQKLPFGCHAWERYEPDFWKEFI